MTSLLRLAQSAINPALHGYSNPHHSPSAAASHHLTDPDVDAFAEPELPDDQDDDSDDDDDDQTLDHYARRQSRGGANATSSSSPAAGTSSASRFPPANAQEHRVPGGYDFEPQTEPIRLAAAAAPPAPRTRPSSTSLSSRDGALALPVSRRASLSSQRYRESSSSYATEHGAAPSASAGGEQPALAVWRGFVTRLRGSNAGGSNGSSAQQQHAGEEGHGLLFSQDDSEDPSDADWPLQRSHAAGSASQYPPPRDPHLPLPPRPPQFAPPPSSSSSASVPTGSTTNAAGTAAGGQRVFGGGQGNDGVFANLAAKPDNPGGLDIVGEGPDKDEVLPPYEAAQHDPSPAYWETTVIAPSGPLGPDDILVDGMPVGNVFSFVWNLLVSMSFQFVGFLLTFILHTTHAAKNGSRAGLGITLIQLGFYLKQRTDGLSSIPGDETGLNGGLGPSESEQSWSWWNGPGGADQPTGTLPSGLTPTATLAEGVFGSLPTQVHGALAGVLAASDGSQSGGPGSGNMPTLQGDGATLEEMQRMSEAANEWMAFVLVTIGSFLLIGSCLAYWRAVRWARAVRAGQGPNNDAESVVAI